METERHAARLTRCGRPTSYFAHFLRRRYAPTFAQKLHKVSRRCARRYVSSRMKSISLISIFIICLIPGLSAGTTIYVKPNYPIEALKKCIEGWVEFEVTVMPDGSFENVKIIESHPEGIFDEAAKEALKKHNLVPKELIGATEPTHGVKRKISYKLDGECVPT